MCLETGFKFWVFALLLFVLMGCASGKAIETQPVALKSAGIDRLLARIVKDNNLVGIVAGVGDEKGLIGVGSRGVLKIGRDEPMTDRNLVHLGSCTKAMTCVLLGTLVEEGKLDWESKMIDVLPELKGVVHERFYDVTLWELVTHRSGMRANAKNWQAFGEVEITARRLKLIGENLNEQGAGKRGDYLYSNMAYMVAGCMAEKVTGKAWEQLMRVRVFEKLGMKSAGFGVVGEKGEVKEPWGHVRKNGEWFAVQSDNAASLGPAGTVHCGVEDWVKFLGIWLPENKSDILSEAMLGRLIKPTMGNYAGGWIVVDREWAKGKAMTHAGSNTTWLSVAWVAPQTGRVYFALVNSYDDRMNGVCDGVISGLIKMGVKR